MCTFVHWSMFVKRLHDCPMAQYTHNEVKKKKKKTRGKTTKIRTASTIATSKITALNHEWFNNAMEGATFVSFVTRSLRQFFKIAYSVWHSAAVQTDHNATSIFTANGNVEENLFALRQRNANREYCEEVSTFLRINFGFSCVVISPRLCFFAFAFVFLFFLRWYSMFVASLGVRVCEWQIGWVCRHNYLLMTAIEKWENSTFVPW